MARHVVVVCACLGLVCDAAGAALRPAAAQQAISLASLLKTEPSDAGGGIAYLLKTVGNFAAFAEQSEREATEKHQLATQGFQTAMAQAGDQDVKLALKQTITASAEGLKQTTRVYDRMVKFSQSLTGLLHAATNKGAECEEITCGPHASCTTTPHGAECVCHEGYVGTGRDCHAPPDFLPHRLIEGGRGIRAADVEVCVFAGNKVAIVFRDTSQRNAGRLLVGVVREAGVAELSPPEHFTQEDDQAFSPVVAGSDGKRLAIAWRGADKSGPCTVRGAVLGGTGIRGAELAVSWGEKLNFCKNQAHKMAVASLPNDMFAVLYSDRSGAVADSFGNSALLGVGPKGAVTLAGRFRFFDQAVCRLEATKLTPTSFVVAARAASSVDEFDPNKKTRQEAVAIYAEFVDGELAFDPQPANLEPTRQQLWARGASLVAPDTVAYVYQDGQSQEVKLAVLHVDPSTHHMHVVQAPQVIHKGVSPYVSMLSMPYLPSDPHTLVYYEDPAMNASMINVCTWTESTSKVGACQDYSWLNQRLASVSGAHLGSGRSFMVFSTLEGVPYYSVFGLSKK